ncbi:MAG: enoyl-CoA hydratase/isomerase family protein [Chloroflexi bacterium]|nr:enoyl-CoA hydratase/isomerase family protein [Chloroflexota bacterium]
MSASDKTIAVERDGAIVTVTINNPPVNALSLGTVDEIERVFHDLATDPSVKAVIITGAGSRTFAAGANIREIEAIDSAEAAQQFARRGQTVFDQIEAFDRPVIAAVNGVCFGGGNELAMACHFRVAAERARFGQPEINLGVIPGWGGTQRLPRLVPNGRARLLLLTGESISAAEAQQIGLVDRVVPDDHLATAALDLARVLASKPAVATRLILRALREGLPLPVADGERVEAQCLAEASRSEDWREGIRAFLEKRPPRFQDR